MWVQSLKHKFLNLLQSLHIHVCTLTYTFNTWRIHFLKTIYYGLKFNYVHIFRSLKAKSGCKFGSILEPYLNL